MTVELLSGDFIWDQLMIVNHKRTREIKLLAFLRYFNPWNQIERLASIRPHRRLSCAMLLNGATPDRPSEYCRREPVTLEEFKTLIGLYFAKTLNRML